jgi:hypothetical protein
MPGKVLEPVLEVVAAGFVGCAASIGCEESSGSRLVAHPTKAFLEPIPGLGDLLPAGFAIHQRSEARGPAFGIRDLGLVALRGEAGRTRGKPCDPSQSLPRTIIRVFQEQRHPLDAGGWRRRGASRRIGSKVFEILVFLFIQLVEVFVIVEVVVLFVDIDILDFVVEFFVDLFVLVVLEILVFEFVFLVFEFFSVEFLFVVGGIILQVPLFIGMAPEQGWGGVRPTLRRRIGDGGGGDRIE